MGGILLSVFLYVVCQMFQNGRLFKEKKDRENKLLKIIEKSHTNS